MQRRKRSRMRCGRQALCSAVFAAILLSGAAVRAAAPVILFVTQPPFGADFATLNSTFGNHQGNTGAAPRGGDLWIRYGDGTLRNLTAEAGFGLTAGAEITVREPSVHWSGAKALFSMVVGGTRQNDYTPVYFQIYEVSGLGAGQTATIRRLAQPASCNNVSPVYGTDDRILFTSDCPRNGDRLTYPQLDEYESTPTVTGLWSMNPDGTDVRILDHAVSGAFTPIVAADGRVIYTRWDHLQRDQQNDAGTYGAFNYSSEASAQALASNAEIFPEPRVLPSSAVAHGHVFNFFFPWQINEDGTGLETVNHVGRHELARYFDSSRDGLPEFIAAETRRTADRMFQLEEDPLRPGYFYGIQAPEFSTHAAGQLIALDGVEGLNADDMQVDYLTHPSTASYIADGSTPPAEHVGMFRNPLPLSDGALVAVHSTSPYADRRVSGDLSSRYDFHLVYMQMGSPYWTPGTRLLPNGISKSISYWDNYSYAQQTYSGPLWELDPVEVIARPRPARHTSPLPAIESTILDEELGATGVEQLRAFLAQNDLALIVSRNVTRRADRQQDFNLRIYGTSTQTVEAGATPVDIAFLQFVQGDLIRGYANFHGGRRPIAQFMHDGINPSAPNAPPASVALAGDGSVAAFVPARRALSWQLVAPDGTPVVRERYWVTFQPGEIRSCGNCHGINRTDVVLHQPPPTNPPQALRDLARWWRDSFDPSLTPVASSPSPTATPTPPAATTATSTRAATSTPTPRPATATVAAATRTPTRTMTSPRTATRTPTRTATRTMTRSRTPTRTPTRTRTATVTRTRTRTATPLRTATPRPTLTRTRTRTPTATRTATRTRTPTRTQTPTRTGTMTRTPTRAT